VWPYSVEKLDCRSGRASPRKIELSDRSRIDDRRSTNSKTTPKIRLISRFYTAHATTGHWRYLPLALLAGAHIDALRNRESD